MPAMASSVSPATLPILMAPDPRLKARARPVGPADTNAVRALLPQLTPDQARTAKAKPTARTLSGYSRRRFVVQTAMTSRGFYDGELRPVLEHLLAARLAERHDVHLYQDPAAARALLCREPRDADLWAWIDPTTRPATTPRGGSEQPGIPRRTLARLIDRLEKL